MKIRWRDTLHKLLSFVNIKFSLRYKINSLSDDVALESLLGDYEHKLTYIDKKIVFQM